MTGACGGLGSALATALRTRGAHVALMDVDANAANARAERLGGGKFARGWAVDVRDLEQLQRVMAEIVEHFGVLDGVVAAAGVLGPLSALDVTSDGDWARVIDINLNGVWRTFNAAAPHVADRRGHLLAISSMIAYIHPPLLGSYAASKAGVAALCDSLRLELATSGVTVGSVHPIIFRTPMIGDALDSPAAVELVKDFTGVFRTVPLETVVAGIVRGLERRSSRVVIPRQGWGAALAPGLAQLAVERAFFRAKTIRRAVELAATTTTREPREALTTTECT